MKKILCLFLAAGSLWVNVSFADTPAEVRVAYSGGSQVLMLAKADGSLDKALNSKVKWVQFASGADALNYFASNAIDIANFGSSGRIRTYIYSFKGSLPAISRHWNFNIYIYGESNKIRTCKFESTTQHFIHLNYTFIWSFILDLNQIFGITKPAHHHQCL